MSLWRYGVVYDWNMQLIMDDKEIWTLEQVEQFVDSSQGIEFSGLNLKEKYLLAEEGKIKNTYLYEQIKTPYEKLKSLPQAETYRRPGINLEILDAIANQMSDNQCAERMVKARSNLLKQTNRFSYYEANQLPPGSFFD